MSILIIFVAILYYFVFTMQDNPDIAATLATLYNTLVAFLFFITPFVYVLPQQKLRNLVLVLVGCSSMISTVAPVQRLSAEEEQKLYFQELQRIWS
jgi:predicted membrane-bound spermidine synthase